MTYGGDGGLFTQESRKKISKNRIESGVAKGKNNPMFGKQRTSEEKKKISDNHADVGGKNNPMFGKQRTYEERLKISIGHGGKPFDGFKKDTGEYIGTWNIQSECAEFLKIPRRNIGNCLENKKYVKSTHGYTFKYKQNT
jgi:group I intron endonuclease